MGSYSHWNARVWPTTFQREQQAPMHRSSPPLLIQDHQDRDQDHQDQDQDETTEQLRERTTARGHESFGGLPQAPLPLGLLRAEPDSSDHEDETASGESDQSGECHDQLLRCAPSVGDSCSTVGSARGHSGRSQHRSSNMIPRIIKEFVVVHSFLLRNDPPLLGNERSDRGHRSPPSSGKGRAGGHGHTHLSS